MKRSPRHVPLVIALAVLGACAPRPEGGGPAAERPDERAGHLIIGIQQEPDKLNTALNSMVYGTYINQAIYGYFTKYDSEMRLIPDVIREVPTLENGGVAPDGLTLTYHLRDDVRWHDGVPFTAADVVFSVETYLDTRHEVESRSGFDVIESMETPGEHTVVFHLREPYVKFVEDVFFDEPIIPRHLLHEHVGLEFGNAAFHRAPVGLGPFRFEEWVSGSHVTVVRNEDYFRGPPAIERITFRFITDSSSLLLALRAGELDGYDNAGTDQHGRLQRLPGVRVHVTPAIQWEHLDLNTEDPILQDVRVRRAIQLAIDRDEISRELYDGLWPPARGDIRPSLEWYEPAVEEIVRHDPDEARALLEEAGWRIDARSGYRAKDGQPLRLAISTTAGRQQRELTEQVLQHQLRDVGIELTIANHNATALFAPFADNGILKRGRFQIAMYAWSSTPDPDRFTLYHGSQIPPPEGQNFPRYRDQRLDELLETGRTTVDPARRLEIYREVQRIIATQVPMTPLVWRADLDPMTERLQNYRGNPTQSGDTWNIHEWRLAD